MKPTDLMPRLPADGFISLLVAEIINTNCTDGISDDRWTGDFTHESLGGLTIKFGREVVRDPTIVGRFAGDNIVEFRYTLRGSNWCMTLIQRSKDMNKIENADDRFWEVEGDFDQCKKELAMARLTGIG